MKVCLTTGISGFVGTYLDSALSKRSITSFGIARHAAKRNIFACDILDKKELLRVMNEVSPDTIFHLAAQSSVEKSWNDPSTTTMINVEGTKNLLDCVLETKIDPRILIIGSGEIYGTTKQIPFKEDSPINPNSPYSKSRLEQERLALKYHEENGLKITITRSFPHTGPGQVATFACPGFAKQIVEVEKNKKNVIKVGNLDARRDYTDVRDMVEAYLLAIQKCKTGEIYNICSGVSHSMKKILDTLISFSTVKIAVKKDASKVRPSDIPDLVGDGNKFKSTTNWEQKIPIEQTLQDILNYWRAQA